MSEAVELIKSEITRRAKEEAEKILSEAEREAQEMVSKAERKSQEVMMTSVKPEVEVMRRRILGSAMLEGRKMMLKAKYEIVLKILNAAEEKLRRIAEGKEKNINYEELLFNLLKEAVSGLGEESIIVSANKRDLSYLSSNLANLEERLSKELGRKVKLTIAGEPQNCIGGVIVKSRDGMKVFNNTLEGRLLKMREVLRGKILKEVLT